ncbi:hypothetical protein [Streptomyces katrae]|uniref:hypothetical protein n=1 Tax=Streptomyces katrae TaxID=68223 RepID=UPI0012FF47F8|nr:hypothetical protein [Streptomyces katrae]
MIEQKAAPVVADRPVSVPLWRSRNFALLWGGQTRTCSSPCPPGSSPTGSTSGS